MYSVVVATFHSYIRSTNEPVVSVLAATLVKYACTYVRM